MKAAREQNMVPWALTGPAPNPLAASCDDAVSVEARSVATVQEMHLVLIHALCASIDEVLVGPQS
ncbi:phosphoheptose isomerase [Mycobacteroides abscessus]|nr:phosphoheptose isomerase [Mycobacteroides abscessus]